MPSLLRRLRIGTSVALTALFFACALVSQAQRTMVASHSVSLTPALASTASGAVPTSQPMQLTLRLAVAPERSAALGQLLADQAKPTSSSYHQWLTPAQFAESYGATDDQIATLTAWIQSQGLTVAAVSPGKTRMTISGTAGQVQQAFAVTLQHYTAGATDHFASTTRPSVPAAIAPLVAGISGLDNLPSAAPMTIQSGAQSVAPVAAQTALTTSSQSASSASVDPFTAAATLVDANTSPILTVTTAACSTDFSQADYTAYSDLFRQANAQGITVLATSSCGTRGTGSFPASLPQVTALVVDPATTTFDAIAPRPGWQAAPGLPADTDRHEPDLTTSSLPAFSQAMTTILQKTGSRQGNINARLYALAPTQDLYTQPDSVPAGTWESSTGLGLVDLATLIKVFPADTGTLATTTSLNSSSYTPTYGAALTLTAKVLAPVYGNANPTGTVTFSAATQGSLGSASVDSSGTAALILTTGLSVGVYNVTATYSGDNNYASSSNPAPAIITVSIVNGVITATISPSSSVPYGATATVTATVTLPNSSAAPSGTVTAAVEGITGAVYSNTLTANPGGNSGTANIVIAVPPPGGSPYTIEVTCAGNQNFQCQSPFDIKPFTTVKGNSLVAVTAVPAAPQAGQPVTLTAVVSNAGNGPGPYSFTGNVTFYDNGKIISTGAVASSQASASVTLSGGIAHSIVASYSGDGNWNSSTSPAASVTPTLLPSAITLTSNVPSALAGVNIVFTATVFTTVSNSVGPTGTIKFFDTYNNSLVQLGTATLTPNGPNQSIAVLSTTGLLAGGHSIYAVYSGDTNFTMVTSATIPETLSDYTISMVPQTLTIALGKSGQAALLPGLIGGFNGTITFGCTPPPGTEMTCSFSPITLTGGGSTTLTIVTTAPSTTSSIKKSAQQARHEGSWRLAAGSTSALATLLCFALPRRRRMIPMLLLALLTVSLPASLGCGLGVLTNGNSGGNGSGTGTPGDPGTPLGTSIFTITTAGTDGVNTVRHNYQYQVTVQ